MNWTHDATWDPINVSECWPQILINPMSATKDICQEVNFDELFALHAEALHSFCYYKCKSQAEAEDYVQEAFVRLWNNCTKVPFQKAKSFLFKVAQNLFLHRVERKKVEEKFLRRQGEKVNLEHPQFLAEHQDLMERLDRAIADLSEKQRVVFLLHRIDGLSYKEIAESLGISVKSVEKRMHRALLNLRTCLPQL